jgi:putative Holliday junction resolvase
MSWIVGLDVGSKTIGLARVDARSGMARPLQTLSRRGIDKDLDALLAVLGSEDIEGFVVGLPLDETGNEQRSTRLARQLGAALVARTGKPVRYQDESHSTLEAEHRLREAGIRESEWAGLVDSWAAAVILEDWLEEQV